ncbi:hypothetical protein M885DRAFT_504342 [Pelagophyceae sp. CCMP2097]|nr:hypothetical protein M885DRAFT_504342 [Pelagophyceae sp. CCMP2097]
MFASICFDCRADAGLCWYAVCCTSCLAAEVSEAVGASGYFGSPDSCAQWSSALVLDVALSALGNICAFGGAMSSLVWWNYYARVRYAMERTYQLPRDELCFDAPWTTFLPVVPFLCDCSCCALYQQAYFVK